MPRSCFVNVGVNTGSGGFRAPIYTDGSFVYAPIPERDDTVDTPAYEDLGINVSAIPDEKVDTTVHFDPEFPEYHVGKNYTYGDKKQKASRLLEELEQGDYLFFYATLEYDGNTPEIEWIHPYWGVYIIGHFRLATDPIPGDDIEDVSMSVRNRLENNAHLRRSEFDADVLILGDPERSQLYERAVPLSESETQDEYKFPEPNQMARQAIDSLDQTTGYGSKPWYRWLMVADNNGTERILCEVGGIQQGDDRNINNTEASTRARFLDATQDGNGAAFDQFMQKQDFTEPPRHIKEVRSMFSEEGWMPETEQALVASFAYIAGGWTKEVPRKILKDMRSTSLVAASEAANQDRMDILEKEDIYEHHPHRERLNNGTHNAEKTPKAFQSFYEEVTLDDKDIRSFSQFVNSLQSKRCELIQEGHPEQERRERLFREACEALEPVSSFGDLARFDWLEVIVRAHGFDWLAPTELKPDYFDTGNGPKECVKEIFPVNGLNDEDIDQYITLLDEYGRQFNIEDTNIAFTLESCLCRFEEQLTDDNSSNHHKTETENHNC